MSPDPLLRFPQRVCCCRPGIVPLSHVCLCSVATDSDTETVLSCFEAAGHSYEDGEDLKSELYCSVPTHLGGRMSQEDRRGEEEDEDEVARVNGVRKHR